MADHFPAEIHIGGPIPRDILDELVKEIVATEASLKGYTEDTVTDESARKAFQEGKIIDLYDDQARYGSFEELENFLIEHEIHFDRHHDSYCEYSAENVYCRGNQEILNRPSNQNGDVLIRRDDIMSILNNNALDNSGKLEALAQLAEPPETKQLEPIRFV